MNWSDEGFLISKNRYNENSLIAELFTKDKGKISGIIFGGTSKKIKNYLQNGNELYLEYHSKNDSSLGYFKIEIIKPLTSRFFSEKKKLNCIVSMLELIKILTVDGQQNKKIYDLINDFFKILDNQNWEIDYIYLELSLLKFIGFNLNISDYCKSEIIENEKKYFIESASKKIIVPNFLIENNRENITDKDIFNSLNLISEYLKKNILIPNNINFPFSRNNFIKYFK